jgi:hypothetical protein
VLVPAASYEIDWAKPGSPGMVATPTVVAIALMIPRSLTASEELAKDFGSVMIRARFAARHQTILRREEDWGAR